MVNILIATHGPLASALIESSQLIVGGEVDITSLGLFLGDSPDEFKENVAEAIDALYQEEGLLIFTDLYGGTPANAVLSKLNQLHFPEDIVCYVGVNLPLLLEAISMSSYGSIIEIREHLNSVMTDTLLNLSDKFANH